MYKINKNKTKKSEKIKNKTRKWQKGRKKTNNSNNWKKKKNSTKKIAIKNYNYNMEAKSGLNLD